MPSLGDYTYDLPPELIAQRPLASRDDSRLLVVDRTRGRVSHHGFRELPGLLSAGDLLVLNDTRVVPARVWARKESGGRVELLFHGLPGASAGGAGGADGTGGWRCRCLTRASKPLREGATLRVETRSGAAGDVVPLTVERFLEGGEAVLRCPPGGPAFFDLLDARGEVPLPPYIHRFAHGPDGDDRARYQTVYAAEPGAVAAPTAGLHFTPPLFAQLRERGVAEARLTLHVGPGTFLPVRGDDYSRHEMRAERYRVSAETAVRIEAHRPPAGRVVAVGTTSVRTLEWVGREGRALREEEGETPLFVTPGHRFHVVDALVTNFHLPGSTLLLLVSAFAGRQLTLAAYREAVRERYRFYSYGDAMLIV